MNCDLCFYVTSIHPWIYIDQIYRQYCYVTVKEVRRNNIIIQPFEHYSNDPRAKGMFVYRITGQSDSQERFFHEANFELKRFLNYLTFFCDHGFKELVCCFDQDNIDKNAIYNERILPPIRVDYPMKSVSTNIIKKSLNEVDRIDVSILHNCKIENALFLYRYSFFQENEGMRYMLRFTALESLVENDVSKCDDKLIRKIVNNARNICNNERLSQEETNKICGHIGQLKKESIRGMIMSTFDRYEMSIDKNAIDVDELCEARNKFVHGGVEVVGLDKLSLRIAKIIRRLAGKVMNMRS